MREICENEGIDQASMQGLFKRMIGEPRVLWWPGFGALTSRGKQGPLPDAAEIDSSDQIPSILTLHVYPSDFLRERIASDSVALAPPIVP